MTKRHGMIELGTLLDIKQVAKTFSVDPQTVRKWVRAGELKAFRIADIMRFRPQDVAQFITDNQTKREAL